MFTKEETDGHPTLRYSALFTGSSELMHFHPIAHEHASRKTLFFLTGASLISQAMFDLSQLILHLSSHLD